MLMLTSWKNRAISPEQFDRMMSIWGQMEADLATDSSSERLCWYTYADATGGMTVQRLSDPDAAVLLGHKWTAALSEFLDIETKVVLTLEDALPGIGEVHKLVSG